ncbi:MAG: hypothetical protein H6Q42_3622 [Deltaproteobacteria bacterium]|nr:hypothetical protein [Deltaproteobacteria bacterium]
MLLSVRHRVLYGSQSGAPFFALPTAIVLIFFQKTRGIREIFYFSSSRRFRRKREIGKLKIFSAFFRIP